MHDAEKCRGGGPPVPPITKFQFIKNLPTPISPPALPAQCGEPRPPLAACNNGITDLDAGSVTSIKSVKGRPHRMHVHRGPGAVKTKKPKTHAEPQAPHPAGAGLSHLVSPLYQPTQANTQHATQRASKRRSSVREVVKTHLFWHSARRCLTSRKRQRRTKRRPPAAPVQRESPSALMTKTKTTEE